MAWAKTVPRGARYDLTASGVPDAVSDLAAGNDHDGALAAFRETAEHGVWCRRSEADSALRDFVAAVAQRYDVEPSCVTPTMGASLAIMHVLIALVRAGDHVIVERPTYEALHRAPEILGARVSRLERKFDEDWRVVPDRLAQLLGSRTRAVILSNLHNPSGARIDRKTLSAVADLASRVGAMVLVDEVYLDYGFALDGDDGVPMCKIAPNGISWSSSTKAFGFSALRAGWIVSADPDAAKAIRSAADYLMVYPPASTLRLGAQVLARSGALTRRAQALAATGLAVVDAWVRSEARVRWVPPPAGLSGFVRLPEFMSDVAFAEHLRERYDTQVVPGTMFEAPGYIRVSFGIPAPELEQGLANISSALDDLT